MQQFHFLTCGQLCAICPGLPTHMQSLKGSQYCCWVLKVQGQHTGCAPPTLLLLWAVAEGHSGLLGLLRRSSSILTYGPVWSTVRLWQAHTVWARQYQLRTRHTKGPLA